MAELERTGLLDTNACAAHSRTRPLCGALSACGMDAAFFGTHVWFGIWWLEFDEYGYNGEAMNSQSGACIGESTSCMMIYMMIFNLHDQRIQNDISEFTTAMED